MALWLQHHSQIYIDHVKLFHLLKQIMLHGKGRGVVGPGTGGSSYQECQLTRNSFVVTKRMQGRHLEGQIRNPRCGHDPAWMLSEFVI